MPGFRVKVHKQGREILVAAADSETIGRTFKAGKLRITVVERFYGTEEADERALVAQLAACTIANLVGPTVVGIAVRHGFVDPANVLDIGGVPHAQLAVM